MTELYSRFADVYSRGPYPEFAHRMLELLPAALDKYGLPAAGRLLDLACGEGSFLIGMSAAGWQSTGLDQSESLLRIARVNAREAGQPVRFIHGDMRRLSFAAEFDLVTCWFDSLNYLLSEEDLLRTFQGVYQALTPGGVFIFDMNTMYGLSVDWQRFPAYVQQNDDTLFEVHLPSYDYENQVASIRIIFFIRTGDPSSLYGSWERVEETHREKSYTLEKIQAILEQAGLVVLDRLGSFQDFSPTHAASRRVWFIVQKPA